MPVPIDFLRGMFGLLCIFFAHMAGRSAATVRQGRGKLSKMYGWILRAVVCAAILVFRQDINALVITIWAIAAAAFAAGMWLVLNQKPHEDLTHQIFPE